MCFPGGREMLQHWPCKKAVESGGIKIILAAVNSHLGSLYISKHACWALSKIVLGSKGNTWLLISSGGATAVAKVRTKWPNDDYVQTKVKRLANLIGTEINSWAVEKPRVNVKGITGLLMSLGGATTVAKVRTKWLDNAYDQTTVQRPDKLIGTAMDSLNVKK
jgi:hypothetical protein